MHWYYKAAIAVALLWGAGRALGVYGEAAREFDLSFFTSFMLTLGGWAAVFMIIDRVAKFLGWHREPASPTTAIDVDSGPLVEPAPAKSSMSGTSTPRVPTMPRRTARRSRR